MDESYGCCLMRINSKTDSSGSRVVKILNRLIIF